MSGQADTNGEGQEAAAELLRRIQAGTREVSNFGGWPPNDVLVRVLRGWLAEYNLDIDGPLTAKTGKL